MTIFQILVTLFVVHSCLASVIPYYQVYEFPDNTQFESTYNINLFTFSELQDLNVSSLGVEDLEADDHTKIITLTADMALLPSSNIYTQVTMVIGFQPKNIESGTVLIPESPYWFGKLTRTALTNVYEFTYGPQTLTVAMPDPSIEEMNYIAISKIQGSPQNTFEFLYFSNGVWTSIHSESYIPFVDDFYTPAIIYNKFHFYSDSIFQYFALIFHDGTQDLEDMIDSFPPCSLPDENFDGICQERYTRHEYAPKGILDVDALTARVDYLAGIDSPKTYCYFDKSEVSYCSNVYLPQRNGISGIDFHIFYERNSDKVYEEVPPEYVAVIDYPTNTSIELNMTHEQLIDLDIEAFYNVTSSLVIYKVHFRIDFFASEDIYQSDMLNIYHDLTIEINVETANPIGISTNSLGELSACNCVIRVDIPTVLTAYPSADDALLRTNPLTANEDGHIDVALGDYVYLEHSITESSGYQDYFDLTFSQIVMTYSGSEFDYSSRATDLCEGQICSDGTVKVSILISVLADPLSISMISILQSRNSRRSRVLASTSEATEGATSFQVQGSYSVGEEVTETQEAGLWVWILIIFFSLGIIVNGSFLIYKRLQKRSFERSSSNMQLATNKV